jgi:hypothetical protein
MDLAKLKQEINADPESVGYAGKSHEEISNMVSRPQRLVDRDSIESSELFAALDIDEIPATPPGRQYLDWALSVGTILLTPVVRRQLTDMFPTGSKTRKALAQLLKRQGSRAEELGLSRVTPSDVADALRS